MKSSGDFTIPIDDSIVNFKFYTKMNFTSKCLVTRDLYLVELVDQEYHRIFVVGFDERSHEFLNTNVFDIDWFDRNGFTCW